jgi:hypothetical protein
VKDTPDGFKTVGIDDRAIAAMEVESIRLLKSENDELRSKTSVLEARVNSLEADRRPAISGLGTNGAGIGVAGIAVAGAFFASRRKRNEPKA